MLVKGTLKGNVLSTDMGDFHIVVHDNWPEELEGIFEIAKITSDSFDRAITVDGYQTHVKIPIAKAEVLQVYTKAFEGCKIFCTPETLFTISKPDRENITPISESNKNLDEHQVTESEPEFALSGKEDLDSLLAMPENPSKEAVPAPQTNLLAGDDEIDVPKFDEAMELFGKPLSELGDTYKLDHSIGRDVIKRIFHFFQKKGVTLDAKTQSFDLRGLAL